MCVYTFVWVGKYEIESLSLHVSMWRHNGITGSSDTDKGKFCFLLRVQVGAGTHFPPLHIFMLIRCVLEYVCVRRQRGGLYLPLVDKNTRLPVSPIHHPPQANFLKDPMTSSFSDLQQQLHDFTSYFDRDEDGWHSRRAVRELCCWKRQLLCTLQSFRPFHWRVLLLTNTIQTVRVSQKGPEV